MYLNFSLYYLHFFINFIYDKNFNLFTNNSKLSLGNLYSQANEKKILLILIIKCIEIYIKMYGVVVDMLIFNM